MARPKKQNETPEWFNLSAYTGATDMDAADWYLNLAMRCTLARTPDKFFHQFLRRQPIVKRAEDTPIELAFSDDKFGPDFYAVLENREPRLNIEYLRSDEFYYFERWLPPDIREFGRNFEPGKTEKKAPVNFGQPIDQFFERRQLRVFTRINLAAPDNVLIDDLLAFVTRERAALARLGGPQPYRAALHELRGRKRPNLKTWARLGVIPYLDIEQWRKNSGATMTQEFCSELLEIEPTDLRETKKYASMLTNEMILNGWLMGFARKEIKK